MNRKEKIERTRNIAIFIIIVAMVIGFVNFFIDFSMAFSIFVSASFAICAILVLYCQYLNKYNPDRYWKEKLSAILSAMIVGVGAKMLFRLSDYSLPVILTILTVFAITFVISYVAFYIAERFYNFLKDLKKGDVCI